MGVLRVEVGDNPLKNEHEHLVHKALTRGSEAPEQYPTTKLQGDYSPDAIMLARENWRRRMLHEHQSSAVFARLLPQLIEAEATLEFKTCVLRFAMDELRHAGLCGRVVALLNGDPMIEAPLTTESLPKHLDCPPLERALRNVLFTSLSETISVGLLTEERERAQEPFVKAVLHQLSADEINHARFGWIYLGDTWPRLDAAGRSRIQMYLPIALGHLEACMLGAMPIGKKLPEALLQEAQALGFSDSHTARSLLADTFEEVIIPQLSAVGLDARTAWNERVKAQ